MAKAAWCAVCGANVYVTDDDTCPQGHGPESLSNYYEAPDLTPADHAQLDAGTPADKRRGTNRTLIIVLVVLGVLVLCGVGACVAGVAGLAAFSKTVDESVESLAEPGIIKVSPAASSGSGGSESLIPGVDLESELYAATNHFFPGFEPVGYYLVGDGTEDPAQFQFVVASTAVPEFKMAFVAYRYADTSIASGDDPAWYFGTDSNALWERGGGEEETLTLYDFVGATPVPTTEESVQIMEGFSAAHPGMVVTGFNMGSASTLTLAGIAESELVDWDGVSASFTSQWALDPNSAAWAETSFTEAPE